MHDIRRTLKGNTHYICLEWDEFVHIFAQCKPKKPQPKKWYMLQCQ